MHNVGETNLRSLACQVSELMGWCRTFVPRSPLDPTLHWISLSYGPTLLCLLYRYLSSGHPPLPQTQISPGPTPAPDPHLPPRSHLFTLLLWTPHLNPTPLCRPPPRIYCRHSTYVLVGGCPSQVLLCVALLVRLQGAAASLRAVALEAGLADTRGRWGRAACGVDMRTTSRHVTRGGVLMLTSPH